jgi:NADH dehydrogenase (ubiquinone) 1 alpha subcomplex subunit 5
MRRTFRQLAAVKPSNYLEPGAPTGLTGLRTHPSPRSALVYLYSRTLDKLAQFPESSLYRQSAEALTKHRMSIVTSIKPERFEEWKQAAEKVVEAHPDGGQCRRKHRQCGRQNDQGNTWQYNFPH